jgi:hypothetical protein
MLERTVYRNQYQNQTMLKRKLEFEEKKSKTERQERIRGITVTRGNRGNNRGGYRGRY